MECDVGFFEEDLICVMNCTDQRYSNYKSCSYDCEGGSLGGICVGNNCLFGQ